MSLEIKSVELHLDANKVGRVNSDNYGIAALSFVNKITGAIVWVDHSQLLYMELFKRTLNRQQLATRAYFSTGNVAFLENCCDRSTAIDLSGDILPNLTPYLHIVEYVKNDNCNCNS